MFWAYAHKGGGRGVNPFFCSYILSSQPNIKNMFFDQRSPGPPEEGVSRRHKHMTESTQWAVKPVTIIFVPIMSNVYQKVHYLTNLSLINYYPGCKVFGVKFI